MNCFHCGVNIPELFFLFCARQIVRVFNFCTVITRRCNEPNLEKLVDSPDKCTTPTTTCSSKRPKVVRLTLQDKFYKSKTSSRFPNFDASNAWQMGHNSRKCFFLGKNCSWTLLPGSTWLQTLITRLNQLCSKLQNTFCFLKHVDDFRFTKALWCLLTTRQLYKVQCSSKQCLRY